MGCETVGGSANVNVPTAVRGWHLLSDVAGAIVGNGNEHHGGNRGEDHCFEDGGAAPSRLRDGKSVYKFVWWWWGHGGTLMTMPLSVSRMVDGHYFGESRSESTAILQFFRGFRVKIALFCLTFTAFESSHVVGDVAMVHMVHGARLCDSPSTSSACRGPGSPP